MAYAEAVVDQLAIQDPVVPDGLSVDAEDNVSHDNFAAGVADGVAYLDGHLFIPLCVRRFDVLVMA